jgi:hypothetical protein
MTTGTAHGGRAQQYMQLHQPHPPPSLLLPLPPPSTFSFKLACATLSIQRGTYCALASLALKTRPSSTVSSVLWPNKQSALVHGALQQPQPLCNAARYHEPHSSFAVPVSPPDAASTPHSAVMSTWSGSTVSSQHCMTTAGYEGAHRRHVARAASVALEVAVREPTVGVIPGTRGRLQQDRGGCAERGQAGARGGASCGRGHHHIGAHEGRAAAGADPASAAMQWQWLLRGNSGPLSLQSLQNCTPS